MKTLAAHPHPADGFASMEIRGDKLTDKENAGAALLDACKEVKNSEPLLIGHYRGFSMSVHYDVFEQKHILTLKGEMSHRAELGADARGNLIRIDNALDKMPDRLEAVKSQLENLYQQQELAKAEVGKPFPFEQELATKTARLIELDMALNLDGKAQAQPEQELAKGKPSVLEKLKATMPIYGVSDKKKTHEMEVRYAFVVDQAHTGLVDLFVNQVRKELAVPQEERRPSVMEKLKAAPVKNAPKISAHSKGQEL